MRGMPILARAESTACVEADGVFEDLMQGTYRQAYGLAYRLSGNADEAADLTQETFVRAYRFFARYDRSLSFTSWIYRIMTNAYVDRVRRSSRLRTVSIDRATQDGNLPEIPDSEAAPDQWVDETVCEPLQQALMSVNQEFRTAVILADVEGLAYEEIADVMGTSVGTVRSRIHRGRRQLRRYLLKHHGELYGRAVREV